MGRTACTEPQCLYKGTLYFYFCIFHSVNLWQRRVTCFHKWHTPDTNIWKRGTKSSMIREVQITVKHYNILILQLCERCSYVCREILWTSVMMTINCWNDLYAKCSVVCIKYAAMRKEFPTYMQHTYQLLSLQTASLLTVCFKSLACYHLSIFLLVLWQTAQNTYTVIKPHLSMFSSEPAWRVLLKFVLNSINQFPFLLCHFTINIRTTLSNFNKCNINTNFDISQKVCFSNIL
jgi:hypothetical protein